MQERILVSGKAGSGKTHLVLQKYSRFVEEHKEDSVIFILPSHSQVEHLRDHILRTSEFKGYLDTGLVTFSILANKIVDSVDSTPLKKLINEGARGLVHGNRGRPSPKALNHELAQRIIELSLNKYTNFKETD